MVKPNHVLLIASIILLFFLTPILISFISYAQPLKNFYIIVIPPGYPIEGQDWEVHTEIDSDSGYIPVENASIAMHTSNAGTFISHTDIDGIADFTYLRTMGDVFFVANYNGATDEWTPETSFVPTEMAIFIVTFFGVGTPTAIWQLITKLERKRKPDKLLSRALLSFSIIGMVLSGIWLARWGVGTNWGISNQILTFGDYTIWYSQHLLPVFLIVLALSIVGFIRLHFPSKKKRLNLTIKNIE